MIVDLIQRQAQQVQERLTLDRSFWTVKATLIPGCALIVTAFAISSDHVTTWLAALYFGASFPIFAQKAITLKPQTAETPSGA